MQTHFQLLANYNQLMNQKMVTAIADVPDDKLWQDKGAFFGSILGTLNHIMVGDLIWLNRFVSHERLADKLTELSDFPKPSALNQILCSTQQDYAKHRPQLDAAIIEFINRLTVDDLVISVFYQNTKGMAFTKPFSQLILHFFNHQTHHRGQVTTLLNQMSIDIGTTDLLMLIK